MAKQVYIEAFFPQVKGNPNRVGRGRGGSAKVAIARGFSDLLKQVRGKRIQTIQATITLTEAPVDETQEKGEQ